MHMKSFPSALISCNAADKLVVEQKQAQHVALHFRGAQQPPLPPSLQQPSNPCWHLQAPVIVAIAAMFFMHPTHPFLLFLTSIFARACAWGHDAHIHVAAEASALMAQHLHRILFALVAVLVACATDRAMAVAKVAAQEIFINSLLVAAFAAAAYFIVFFDASTITATSAAASSSSSSSATTSLASSSITALFTPADASLRCSSLESCEQGGGAAVIEGSQLRLQAGVVMQEVRCSLCVRRCCSTNINHLYHSCNSTSLKPVARSTFATTTSRRKVQQRRLFAKHYRSRPLCAPNCTRAARNDVLLLRPLQLPLIFPRRRVIIHAHPLLSAGLRRHMQPPPSLLLPPDAYAVKKTLNPPPSALPSTIKHASVESGQVPACASAAAADAADDAADAAADAAAAAAAAIDVFAANDVLLQCWAAMAGSQGHVVLTLARCCNSHAFSSNLVFVFARAIRTRVSHLLRPASSN
jgi:hypothetical protein